MNNTQEQEASAGLKRAPITANSGEATAIVEQKADAPAETREQYLARHCSHGDREWRGPNWTCVECGDVMRQAATGEGNAPREFKWSSRNFVDGWWKTFFYCKLIGFEHEGPKYYGRNDWRTEQAAIEAQEQWEARMGTEVA